MNVVKKFFASKKPLIGVIHLPALPGYAEHPGMGELIKKALKDLGTLQKAGFDGVLIENDGDHPPHIGPNLQISKSFSTVITEVLKKAKIPVGLEILYDMPGTIELAAKVKANFVRLDVFVDSGKTKYGPIVYAESEKIITLKNSLYPELFLITDVQVKHLTMLGKKSLTKSVKEAIAAGSDAIIVTGVWTGKEPTLEDCQKAKKAAGDVPVFIGSGLTLENAKKFLTVLDGGIVGTSIKTGQYIDETKAKMLKKTVLKLTYG